MRGAILLSIVLAGCASGTDDPSPGDEPSDMDPGIKVQWQQGIQQAASTSNLADHGGRILPKTNVYTIWWGDQSAFPADAKSGVASLFGGMNGTTFLGIANQYMRGSTAKVGTITSFDDTSSPPSGSPSTFAIAGEACKVIKAHGLSADPSAIYFIYTSNFPSGVNFCAWHSAWFCGTQLIQVAYMPNTTGINGCDPGNAYQCNTYSQGTRSLGSVSSHEFMEAITDAMGTAWYGSSSSNDEIADKCAWKFSSCVGLSNGAWQLQQEWSNAAGGCVQQ